jgi:hypothetical protein
VNFPRPMLNSPCGTAAGNAFYANVVRRVAAWRDSCIEMAYVAASNEDVPDYAKIVRQTNLCIAEIRPRMNMEELVQMLLATPIEEIETLLKKLQKMQHDVQ